MPRRGGRATTFIRTRALVATFGRGSRRDLLDGEGCYAVRLIVVVYTQAVLVREWTLAGAYSFSRRLVFRHTASSSSLENEHRSGAAHRLENGKTL